MNKNKCNILITSAGQRVSLVKFFQKELKSFFPEGKVVAIDSNPSLAPACIIADSYEKVPSVNHPDYISVLLKICIDRNIKVVIPTIDTELLLLSENKERFEENGIIVVVSELPFVSICRDKRSSNLFFESKGIEIPKIIDKFKPDFPLFIKPYDGSLSKNIFKIDSIKQLTIEILNNPKLMFMEYISADDYEEFTVDTYYDRNSNLKCVIPRKRIFVRAGEVSKSLTLNNILVDLIKKKFDKINGAIGCITMQFFLRKEDSRILGIEINPRFGGGFPLSYLAGGNFPRWIIKEYILNESISYFDAWIPNLLMLRYDAEVLIENYSS